MTTISVENESARAAPPRRGALFVILLAAALVALAAIVPALLFLMDPQRQSVFTSEPIDRAGFVAGFIVANLLISAAGIAIGLRLERRVGMGVPRLRAWLNRETLTPAAGKIAMRCLALALAIATVLLLGGFVFRSHLPRPPDGFVFPPAWQGSLLMLGAAVREEILFRLFALNLLAWIGMKLLRQQEPAVLLIWTANILTALVFSALHLAPASQLLRLTSLATATLLLVFTAMGAVFGYIYWRHGLLLAIWTHAIAGLALYLGVRAAMAAGG